MSQALHDLKAVLKEDSEYTRFRRIVDTVRSSLSVEENLKEAAFLHASRKSRTLHAKKMSPTDLQEAIIQELSARSRLVELRALMSRQYELLGTALETITKHVRVRYHDTLLTISKQSTERARVVDKLLAAPIRLKSELSGSFEVIDSYIKDIDSASYALKNSVELLRMILDRRGIESI
jgi:hypothetical protein